MYTTVSTTDDQESLLPATEVDLRPRIGDDKGGYPTEIEILETGTRTRRKSLASILTSYRWLLDTSLLLVIIALMVILLRRDQRNELSAISWQVGGDFTGAGPKIPTQIAKFEPDMSFTPMNTSEFFTDETLARWNTIMPVGTGFPGPGRIFATTSMTHQLHCVYMMARIFSGLVSGNTQDLPADYHFHFLHCVDYVRQGIMCSADLALEVHEPDDSDDFGPLDGGWSGHHVCKDYSKVISYLEGQITDGVRIILPIDD